MNMPQTIYPFLPTIEVICPPIAAAGGKGVSLIQMVQADLPVPPGFVLGVDFFSDWWRQLKQHPLWQTFLTSESIHWSDICPQLKALCQTFAASTEQQAQLSSMWPHFQPDSLFAVRSSAPEEDLAGASFAGGYETILGVSIDKIWPALRHAFASCLDLRVALYKQENGFDPYSPKIAVVVQQQIASDTAGVGFSLNPLNNAYDEAVFNANWGLGESVVAGQVSPDFCIVDKVKRQIVQKQTGKKETSIWLKPGGETEEKPAPRKDTFCLSETQILQLSDEIQRIEALYGRPMDIEWAFAEGQLYLLQARPITTYVPLPPEMQTAPGQPKRLYLDVMLSVQGLRQPISVMGTSVVANVLSTLCTELLGHDVTRNPATTIPFACEGRLYLNVSNILAFIGKDKAVRGLSNIDSLAAQALQHLDVAEYQATHHRHLPPLHLFWQMPKTVMKLLEARILPEHMHQQCQAAMAVYFQELPQMSKHPLDEVVPTFFQRIIGLMKEHLLPAVITGRLAIAKLQHMFADLDVAEQLERLDRSLSGNVTIEMGLELERLARLLPKQTYQSAEELKAAIHHQHVSADFATQWEQFLRTYGHRAHREFDIATPRYRDEPELLLEQMVQLSLGDPEAHTPLAIYNRSQQERQAAYAALGQVVEEKGWLQSKRFHSLYHVMEILGGYRETPKFCLIFMFDLLRTKLLEIAEQWVQDGRLQSTEQIFDLQLDDVCLAQQKESLDLITLSHSRSAFIRDLSRVKSLPQLIDSRGRIIRPPARPPKTGELAGQPISAGVATGKVKVLHTPNEKPLLPGEVLVTYATDPGWTPLFINASAIVLEVGGMLQHGALVAREYGKPCVAGIEGVTEHLKDGMTVEVDGSTGLIRFL